MISDSDGQFSAPLQRIELRETVTIALRDMILAGGLQPGDRIIETELAERFGTSRGPVRDAIADLEHAGLVRTVPRRGSFVATLTSRDVEELYSFRLLLEEFAVSRAVERVRPGDVRALEDAINALANVALDETAANREADLAFHRVLVEIADHQLLLTSWERVAIQTMFLMGEFVHPALGQTVDEHRSVLEAIAKGRGDAAVGAIRLHLHSARDIALKQYGDG